MKKRKYFILLGSLLFLGVIGISYAYWTKNFEQTNFNKLSSGCFDLTFESNSKEIMLEDAFPIRDEDGMKLTPYTFTIRNTCNTFLSYQVTLNMSDATTLNSQYVAAVLDSNQIQTLNAYEELEPIRGYKETRLLHTGSLSEGDLETFSLRVWMDESVGPEDTDAMNKLFQGKIIITASPSTYSPVEQGFNTLADAMLVNEYQSTSLESAKEKIQGKQAPDFTKTAPIIDWQEVHKNSTSSPSATMIDPANNNSATPTSDVNSKIRIGKSYTFNKETGRYTITDLAYYDPTTITDYDTTDYYWCSSGVNFSASDTASGYTSTGCVTMYKLLGATKEPTKKTGPSGKVFNMIQYTFNAYSYTQGELESDKSDKGLYVTDDDNGKTYYYRGSVNNNYVKFGGFYWRIIRLNGDGSVRLLYAGTTPTATGNQLSIDRITSTFNSKGDNPAYAGYMYGNTLGVDYNSSHANQVDSTIKTKLDNWYKKNIVEKGLSNYVVDSVFCNDRSLQSGDGVSTTKDTNYAAEKRYSTDKNPTYVCVQPNDRFTVSEEKGNGALTYPIGLITIDELMYAGMTKGYLNRMSYVYSNQHYWTMSPANFGAFNFDVHGFVLNSAGFASHQSVISGYGVRAVINLKSDALITGGIGTMNDPFVVS